MHAGIHTPPHWRPAARHAGIPPAMHAGIHPPPTGDLLQGMLGYLLQCMLGYTPPWTESQTPVKTLPWPNFVAAGKNTYQI